MFPLHELLELAELPRSTFYYHAKRKQQGKDSKYVTVIKVMHEIYQVHHGRYGYRRMTAELKRQGHNINHKTVLRLMRQEGLLSRVRMRKYKSYRGEVGEKAPNLLERDFTASAPNEKWVTDVTEFHLFGRKIFLSPIIDLFNGEIISYTISDHPRFSCVMDMLKKALVKLPKEHELILHSDQGWQYRMKAYCDCLKQNGIVQSMSRKGNCLDNAMAEGFFGHLKAELLYNQSFDSVEHFVEELHTYLRYYNENRIRSCLGFFSGS